MLHFLTAGHIDKAAACQAKLCVLQPLDGNVLERLLNDYRDGETEALTFEHRPVTVTQGCVRCPWYLPRMNVTSLKFVLALQAATGCLIADVEHGRIVTPAELSNLLPK